MMQNLDSSTLLALLTVNQFKELVLKQLPQTVVETQKEERKYVYGIAGIARLFNCSIPTANRIKASGKIDKAIKQIGRKIVVDAHTGNTAYP